jgi:hypothetical protein
MNRKDMRNNENAWRSHCVARRSPAPRTVRANRRAPKASRVPAFALASFVVALVAVAIHFV